MTRDEAIEKARSVFDEDTRGFSFPPAAQFVDMAAALGLITLDDAAPEKELATLTSRRQGNHGR